MDVCPTGIDIRNGLQLECIGCTDCIDACDEIMDKIGKPRGLVRFDSSRGFETGRSRLLRPRFFIYGVVMLGLLALFAMRAADRKSFSVTSLRTRGLPFTIEQGRIRNLYTLQVENKDDRGNVYFVGPAEGALAGHEGVEFIVPQPRVQLAAMGGAPMSIFVSMPRESYTGLTEFAFTVRDSASGAEESLTVRFRGP